MRSKKKKAEYSKELAELQAQYGRELEGIRAEIGRAVFVTNVHFETEFDALKRTFEAATNLKLIFVGLRPFFEISPPNKEQKIELLQERLGACMKAYDAFVTVYEDLSLFYPRDIYDRFQECDRAVSLEINQIRTTPRDLLFVPPDWYELGLHNQEKFGAAYHAASELIRGRIASLAVIGRTSGI